MLVLNEKKYAMNLLLGKNQDVKSAIKKIGYITRYNAQILGKDDNENYNSTVAWMKRAIQMLFQMQLKDQKSERFMS